MWTLPTQAWNKAKISPNIPLKTALSKRENHSTDDSFWLVESRDAHRLGRRKVIYVKACYSHDNSLGAGCTRYWKSSQWGYSYRAVSGLSKYIEVFTPVILPSLPRHQPGQITSKLFSGKYFLWIYSLFFFLNAANPCFNSGSLFHSPSARFSSPQF